MFLLPQLPPSWVPVLLVLLTGAAAWRWPSTRPWLGAALGLAWAQWQAGRILQDPFPAALTRQDVQLEGRIASLPEIRPVAEARRFLFEVESLRHDGRETGFRGLVRLTWYRKPPPLAVGARHALTARLKPPHGLQNPGGFDREGWFFRQGIRATGYVRDREPATRLAADPGPYWLDRWRQGLGERLRQGLEDTPGAALVRALVLGDRSGLENADWEVLTRTGVNHLVAISGLHVGLVAASLFWLLRQAWARGTRLTLWLAAPRAAALGAFGGAWLYSALAGFAISTQRALIMLGLVLAARFWARTLHPASTIAFALAGVLLVDPGAVLSHGFWLSFGAVAALLYALGNRLPNRRWWHSWGAAQWTVAIGLLPLLLLAFGRASLIAPGINFLAVPLFSLVLPLVLGAALPALTVGWFVPLQGVADALGWSLDRLAELAAWEWAAVAISARPTWVWAVAFGGSLLLLSPRGLPGRWLGMLLLWPLVLVRPPVPAPGTAELWLLDVGQGLSAVVRTAGHTLVYDTGPGFPSGFNTGQAVLRPFLREQGIAHIDTLVISHSDRDHAGGLAGLAAGLGIGRLLSGEPDRLEDPRAQACRAGERWDWDGVAFELLHPVGEERSGNDRSCVLRVSSAGAGLLLTGDISRRVEARLLASRRASLSAALLVAPHHGSAHSSSRAFLEAVAPRWVLYASGQANRFGFPAAAVRQRVAAIGAKELNTAEAGAIRFVLTASGVAGPWRQREQRPRIWTHRP